jgi:hypothetical protein
VTHPLAPLARALAQRSVRYVLIGVSGANLYGPKGQAVFTTEDLDLFLPPDPDNLDRAWAACDNLQLELWLIEEPLDRPRDRWLAERIVQRRAVTRATGPDNLLVNFTLVMKGFEFETVWAERRTFVIEGVPVPTARLLHIVTSKQAAGRPKDHYFLATHQDALEQLLKKPPED